MGYDRFVNILLDLWIAELPSSWWPTFINMKVGDSMRVYDQLIQRGRAWDMGAAAQLFSDHLVERVLSLSILAHCTQDVRV